MFEVAAGLPIQQAAIALVFLLSLAVVYRVDRPGGRWGATLRRRFVVGIPWGTVVSVCLVLAVYLFVQGGLHYWYAPLVIPFRAWSYFYPLGMLTAGLSHGGPAHLTGNLIGTLTFAPIAEYAWGHFPRRRGSTSFGSWRTNPYVRAFVLFPAGVVAAALLTSFFALGPIIGFSGVVFVFAGVALVYYPLTTVLAVVAGRVVRTVYTALQSPTLTATAEPSFSSPWWADIAIQGHALGLFVGVLAGVMLSRAHDADRPSALRAWTGILLFAVTESLWAVYWYRGGETYVLFRAVGVVLVVLLALLVSGTVSVPGSEIRSRFDLFDGLPWWRLGATLLLFSAAGLAGPAIPYNLYQVTDDELPGHPVQIRDYEVTYAEDVQNGLVATFDVDAFGESTNVTTSGVIVRSERRHIWITAVSKSRLAFAGRARVRVGGPGWREVVRVQRDGWTTVGGGTAYRVGLQDGDAMQVAYTSPPATAEPVVAGRNVTVVPTTLGYRLNVTAGNRSAVAPLPTRNESIRLGGIRIVRNGTRLYAVDNATRVRVASAETYPGQR